MGWSPIPISRFIFGKSSMGRVRVPSMSKSNAEGSISGRNLRSLTLSFNHADNRAAAMPEVISIFDVMDYEAQIARGAASLRSGGIVVLPTETVYGAAGNLSQDHGNSRLRALRNSS